MNILVLSSAYPEPDDNGAVITPTVKYYCEQWAEAGHKVIVIHNNSCFPAAFYMIPEVFRKKLESKLGHTFPPKISRTEISYGTDKLKVFRCPMVKVIPYGKFGTNTIRSQVKKITDILHRESFAPDVIISHWVNPQVELVDGLRKVFNAKTSIVFHGDCTEKNIKRFDLKRKIELYDAVGCRNEAYVAYVKDVLQLPKKPFICYSGIPNDLAEEQIKHLDDLELNESLEFIYVGRLVKYKNVDVIIHALNQIYGDRDWRLHIVGSGAEKDNLIQLTKNLGCERNVIFHGQMSRNDVFELMKKCYCFIMVSNNETFGMVYIEAMLAGCITIASKNGGVDGVIVDGENGFLSEQGDVQALADTLSRIEMIQNLRELRIHAINTAYEYKDSKLAENYLMNVMNWNA